MHDGQVGLLGDEPPSDDITAVFDYWRQSFGKTAGAKLTAGRRQKIRSRLAEGYTVDRIKRAIDGCRGSDFHVENGHTDLTLILRSGEKLEWFEAKPGPDDFSEYDRA